MKCEYATWSYLQIGVIFIVISLSVPTANQPLCENDQFQCEDNFGYDSYSSYDAYSDSYTTDRNCIPATSVCDGKSDCVDCSDEKNCTNSSLLWCSDTNGNLQCYPPTVRCDNHSDCLTGEDECGCPGAFNCISHSDEVQCVPASVVCDGKADCVDGEDENHTLCQFFECPGSKKQVLLSKLCDTVNDCEDRNASDECNCSTTFKCDDGRCLHESLKCNGVLDCVDGNDECECDPKNGTKKFFRCKQSGLCIKESEVCDGKIDCGSKQFPTNSSTGGSYHVMDCSDEFQGSCATHFKCQDTQVALSTGVVTDHLDTCVPNKVRCDGNGDCKDASDECSCPQSVFCPAPGGGNEHTERCMQRKNFCDATSQCQEGSDELKRGFGFKCRPNSSHVGNIPCVLPQFMIDDGFSDCSGRSDVCYRDGKWRCFQCFDTSMVISESQLCDGIIDCPDLSDECACSAPRPPLCERICGIQSTNCSAGTISCYGNNPNATTPNNKYIPFSQICDGTNDCLNASTSSAHDYIDEASCVNEEKNKKNFQCPSGNPSSTRLPPNAVKCDHRPECSDLSDECDPDHPCDTVPEFCKHVAEEQVQRYVRRFICSKGLKNTSMPHIKGIPGSLVCNGEVDCAGIGEDELNCTKRYYCETKDELISIDETRKCDGRIDCLNQSDEMNCSNYFYCENGQPLYVPKSSRFDGRDDCSDLSDECPTKQLEVAFASHTDLIASPFFRIMVWLMATVSTIGSLVIIGHQIALFTCKKNIGTVALCNRIMILNLALADFLTGIYLIILGSKIVQFSGAYCHQDNMWRTSVMCANLGLLNAVATEEAVVILVIMTTYRLLAVYKPFYVGSIKPRKVLMMCISTWLVVILVMVLPRVESLSDYFSNTAWYPLPFFESNVVEKQQILDFIKRYNVLTGHLNTTTDSSWASIENFVKENSFNESQFGLFGYYSKHSVCIPNMLAGLNDAGVGFSAFITGFNMVAFIYVVVSYIFIYKGAVGTVDRAGSIMTNHSRNSYVMRTQSTKPLTSSDESKKSKASSFHTSNSKASIMQRRILRLVATNLACWLPLTIMAILKLLGVELSSDAYAWAAIVLLPITSALNPLVYSDVVSTAWKYVKKTLCGKTRSDSLLHEHVAVTDRSQLSTSMRSARI